MTNHFSVVAAAYHRGQADGRHDYNGGKYDSGAHIAWCSPVVDLDLFYREGYEQSWNAAARNNQAMSVAAQVLHEGV